MSTLKGLSVLVVLACSPSLALAATATAPPPRVPALPDAKAFVASVQSGEIDAENYDFASAGFFQMSRDERMQWLAGIYGFPGLPGQPGAPLCTDVGRRNAFLIAWVQVVGQSASADDWKSNASALRTRLAELDQLLKQSGPEKTSADPLVQELMVRFARDQAARNPFGEPKWTAGLPPTAAGIWVLAANTRLTQIDCDNTAWLQAQLAKTGWFTISKYGAEADMAAWHLVQHADREPSFQREVLAKLQALPAGETSGKRLGMLIDRVARAEGRLQKYGTQGHCDNGQWTPFESEDPANLDSRRASLGMLPIAEHTEQISRENCPH